MISTLLAALLAVAPYPAGYYDEATQSCVPLSGGTMSGNLDMNANLVLNIGNAGTDFTSSGGLVLAAPLTASGASSANTSGVVEVLDSVGLQGGNLSTDVVVTPFVISPQSAWAADTVNNTPGAINLQNGIGSRRIAMTAANCSTDTISVTVGTTTTGTEGTQFSCSTTDAACATSVAAWLDGLSGVIATANSPTSGTVYIQRANAESGLGVGPVDLNTSDTTCAAIVQSADAAFQVRASTGLVVLPGNFSQAASESSAFRNSTRTVTLTNATTIANWREVRAIAPTLQGRSGGGTETVTTAATLYVDAAPINGGNLTITNGPYALWVDAGTSRLDGDLDAQGLDSFGTRTTVTVDGATTFAAPSSYFVLACTGAESIDTITGATRAGTIIYIEDSDTDCTINDDDAATASNAIDLTGTATNDVGAVAKVIALIYTGSSWMELFESDN